MSGGKEEEKGTE